MSLILSLYAAFLVIISPVMAAVLATAARTSRLEEKGAFVQVDPQYVSFGD